MIYAEEILWMIGRGEDICIRDANIIDDLDIGDLYINHEKIKIITSNILIENSNIHGEIHFANVVFNGSVTIKDTRLWNSFICSNTTFKNKSSFENSRFREKAFFIEVIFETDVYFLGAEFFKIASFEGTAFKESGFFESTEFRDPAIFNFVNFDGDSIFDEACFHNVVYFRDGKFKGSTRFIRTTYHSDAYFNNSKFIRDISFKCSNFLNNVDFRFARIQDGADFTNINIRNKINLDKCKLFELNVSWDDIKDHLVENDYVYTALKNNFKNLNNSHDEDECYIQYRKWLLKTRKYDSLWFIDKVADLSCGYGYKPLKLLGASLVVISIFSIVYYFVGFAKIDYEFSFINSTGSFKLSFGPTSEYPMDVYRSLYFSAMTYFGKKASSFEPPHILWGLVLLETALGYVALGVLISIVYRIFTRGSDR